MAAQGQGTIYWNSAGNLANARFLYANGISATESTAQLVMNAPGRLSDLVVALTVAPGAANSRTFTVRKNGVNTALAVTISGAATTGSDTVDTVPYLAGDLISLEHTNSGGVNATGIASVSM